MAKLGLLGALAGLGEGMQTVGLDIAKRREKALEDARELAKEQRATEQRALERKDTQEFQIGQQTEREDRQDARAQMGIEATASGRASTQAHQDKMAERRFKEQTWLTKYRANLALSNSKAAKAYGHQLSQGDIVGIGPGGAPTKDGYVNVVARKRDGSMVPTGQQVKKEFFMGKTRATLPGADLSLTPDDDDEEDQ